MYYRNLFCLLSAVTLGIIAPAIFSADTSVPASQFITATPAPSKIKSNQVITQSPNGQTARVIVIGPQALNYEVTVQVGVKGQPKRTARCHFSLAQSDKNNTCILNFSHANKTTVLSA